MTPYNLCSDMQEYTNVHVLILKYQIKLCQNECTYNFDIDILLDLHSLRFMQNK